MSTSPIQSDLQRRHRGNNALSSQVRWSVLQLLVILLMTGITDAFAADPRSLPAPPGTLFDIGDHRLHLNCSGSGSPTVILDAGLGGNSIEWVRVQPELSNTTRVCSYDRAGYGWSELGPLPRTSAQIVNELYLLLKTAKIKPPYVLVGHSFGGYNVRLYSHLYPDEVAGLVLVDASHENQFQRFRRNGSGINIAPRGHFVLHNVPKIPDGMPQHMRELSRKLLRRNDAQLTIQAELASLIASASQIRSAIVLPDVPLVVVSRGKRVLLADSHGEIMERTWSELQLELTRLTANSMHVIANHSGHHIHLDEPSIVISSVKTLISAYRTVSDVKSQPPHRNADSARGTKPKHNRYN